MDEFSMDAILDMQRQLQDRYRNIWAHMCPEEGRNKLLWMICELGEVIDILKKKDSDRIMNDPTVRRDFVEELADVLMYFGDVLLCYDISADELWKVYGAKWQRNMRRWNPETGEQER